MQSQHSIMLHRPFAKGLSIPARRASINEEVYGEFAGIPWHGEQLEGVLLQVDSIPDGGRLCELLGRRVRWHCQRSRCVLMRVLTTLDDTHSIPDHSQGNNGCGVLYVVALPEEQVHADVGTDQPG